MYGKSRAAQNENELMKMIYAWENVGQSKPKNLTSPWRLYCKIITTFWINLFSFFHDILHTQWENTETLTKIFL